MDAHTPTTRRTKLRTLRRSWSVSQSNSLPCISSLQGSQTHESHNLTALPCVSDFKMPHNLDLRCVLRCVLIPDPSILGAGGPNQNTSRIRNKKFTARKLIIIIIICRPPPCLTRCKNRRRTSCQPCRCLPYVWPGRGARGSCGSCRGAWWLWWWWWWWLSSCGHRVIWIHIKRTFRIFNCTVIYFKQNHTTDKSAERHL